MDKRLLITMCLFAVLAAIIPAVSAANITADSTSCLGYTELYYEGSTSKLAENCLLRVCLAENRSASFYFKYAKAHKEIMKVTLKDYAQGIFEWSNGYSLTTAPNSTIKIDIDKNGYYDQRFFYEFQKPEITQACFKTYEIKEGSAYKVPSPNDAYLTATTTSTAGANISATGTANSTANASANATAASNNSNATANPAEDIAGNATETVSGADNSTDTAIAAADSSAESQSGSADATANSNTDGSDIAGDEATAESDESLDANRNRMVVGISIIVAIVALIVILYLVYERKRKHDFSVQINEEIGKVDLGKKQ